MLFRQIFDPKLAQYAYLIGCQKTKEALIVDPQRDIDIYVRQAKAEGLTIVSVAETHIHADFLSGAREFAERYDTMTYLSDEGDADWKYAWVKEHKRDGSPYRYQLLNDGGSFYIGNIEIVAVHTPGHTPEHLSYLVIDRGAGATTPIGIATGDFVFVGDLGRPDLLEQAAGMHGVQEPAARQLFNSLPRFNELQDYLQVWPAHGAGSACGKALGAVPTTTVGYEKLYNASLNAAQAGEDAFVRAILSGQPEPPMYFGRMKRDNKVGAPVLGELPTPQRLSEGELHRMATRDEVLLVDTRLDRSRFMARHIPGSLYAPMNKTFNTVVGSLVIDERTPVVLLASEENVEGAVRDLIRIGFDNVLGYADFETVEAYFNAGHPSATIEEIGIDSLDERVSDAQGVVLDVRYLAEYASSHVDGAINASYTRLPDYLDTRVPAGKRLFVHCGSGARAAAASAYLAREGYDVVYVNGLFSTYAHPVKGEAEAIV